MEKIWVTFQNSGGLYSRGLGKVYFWLQEPSYMYYKPWKDSEMNGLSTYGWHIPPNGKCYSVGDFFGYDSDISHFIWDSLADFFGTDKLIDWDSKIKGKTPDLFLLELDLTISFCAAGKN